MAKVELKEVSKIWNSATAVEASSIEISNGEFVAILGPSGCGKSTTLFMLAGIYAPNSGEILFDDQVVNEVESRDRNVGIVFQSYALYQNMTVLQNIMFPLKFKNINKEQATTKAIEAARSVQVEDLLERKPSQLSGGQQQRVALARALVKEPQLLLLDEPLSNLDATLRLSMRTEIKSLQQRLNLTTILVTHDQIEATTMADRIVCMNQGRIEQIGSPDDLYLKPATLFVASFIGSPPINLIEGEAKGGMVSFGGHDFYLSKEITGPVTLGIRPEDIQLDQPGIQTVIKFVEPMGREILYTLDSEFGELRALEIGNIAKHSIAQDINISFSSEKTLLFDTATSELIANLKLSSEPLDIYA